MHTEERLPYETNGDYYCKYICNSENDVFVSFYDSYFHNVGMHLIQNNALPFNLLSPHSIVASPHNTANQTVQLNIQTALSEHSDFPSEIYSGTNDIFIALSDPFYKQIQNANTLSKRYSFMTTPLVKRGVAVNFLNIDRLQSQYELNGVKLLVLCYDFQKPIKENTNIIISDWVKNGGHLLIIGGSSTYGNTADITSVDFLQSPLNNLFNHLGLKNIAVSQGITENLPLHWEGFIGRCYGIGKVRLDHTHAENSLAFKSNDITPILKCGLQTIAFEWECDHGDISCFGIDSSWYSASRDNEEIFRQIAEYAAMNSNIKYTEKNLVLAKKSNLIAAHVNHKTTEIKGDFINLFYEDLPVTDKVSISPHTPVLLYDLSHFKSDIPKLAFGGGNIESKLEYAAITEFIVSGESNIPTATRILSNGKKFIAGQSVCNGQPHPCEFIWDETSQSLLVKVSLKGDQSPVKITVKWI